MKHIADKLQNKKALFIVESPLQIMCAYEAIKTIEPKKVKIIVRLAKVGKNQNQMLLLIRKFLFDYDVEKVYLNPRSRSLKFVLTTFVLFIQVFAFYGVGHHLFIGDYRSKFAKLLTFFAKPERKIYLDDGTATLDCPLSILNKSYSFSIFDLSTSFHIKNKFINLSKILLKNKRNRKNVVIFIGSPIRQIEAWMKGDYFKAIEQVKKKYKTMDFFYFPHRRELREDLDKISSYGVQVLENNYPIEMFYLEFQDCHPKVVASLYSTAMFTMNLIYGSKVVMCDGIMEENTPALESVFNAIKKIENIDIVVC